MASFVTRAEWAGSIFFRVTGLLRSGQMQWNDRPLWYDVYAAKPPLPIQHKEQPPTPIFYEEDTIRALFYRKYRPIGHTNIERSDETIAQQFIRQYQAVREQGGRTDEEVVEETEKRLHEAGIQLHTR